MIGICVDRRKPERPQRYRSRGDEQCRTIGLIHCQLQILVFDASLPLSWTDGGGETSPAPTPTRAIEKNPVLNVMDALAGNVHSYGSSLTGSSGRRWSLVALFVLTAMQMSEWRVSSKLQGQNPLHGWKEYAGQCIIVGIDVVRSPQTATVARDGVG